MPPTTTPQAALRAADQIRKVLDAAGGGQRSLATYHTVGRILRGCDVGWGGKKNEVVAAQLKNDGIEGMGVSTLNKIEKFAQNFTAPQAKTLDKRKVSWRAADRLFSKHLSPAVRTAMLKDASAGRIAPKSLGKAITRRSSVDATRGCRSVQTAIQRAEKEVEFLLSVARGRGNEELKMSAETSLRKLRTLIDGQLP
jgi:hypothetical protein